MRFRFVFSLIFLIFATGWIAVGRAAAAPVVVKPPVATPAPAPEDAQTAQAREAYEQGLRLFDNRQYDFARGEFERSYELRQRPPTLFMLAQCEYLLGHGKRARDLYQRYVTETPEGPFVEFARGRVQAIEAQPVRLIVNTDPDDVTATFTEASGMVIKKGIAPNTFELPPGRYTMRLEKPGHRPVVKENIAVEPGDAPSPLFHRLPPIPAHLRITTDRGARLYVNGALVTNPYEQAVSPGRYEVYAEGTAKQASSFSEPGSPGTVTVPPFELDAGERKDLPLAIPYIQRSGRAELLVWSTLVGGALGVGGVLALLSDPDPTKQNPASGTLLVAGAGVGGFAGFVSSSLLAPKYIPDNRALFVIGGMWVGIAEGAAVGLTIRNTTPAAAIGSVAGLGAGTATAALLADRAPTYGRAALIQSAAIIGGLSGGLLRTSLEMDSALTGPFVLGGLNAGLATGLGLAYLSDQAKYGPTIERVILIDLATAAGAAAGATLATVQSCIATKDATCSFASAPRTARLTLAGGLTGLAAGMLFTRNVGRADAEGPPPKAVIPVAIAPTVLPAADGQAAFTGLSAFGRF